MKHDPNSIDNCKHPELHDVRYNVEIVQFSPLMLEGVGGWLSEARCSRCNARIALVVPKDGGKLLVWARLPPVEERYTKTPSPDRDPKVLDMRTRQSREERS